MKKLLTLLLAICIAATFGISAFATTNVHDFYSDGVQYAIHFWQNGTDDPSFGATWGGFTGISDKNIDTDAVIYVECALGFISYFCDKIGVVLDDSDPIWLDADLRSLNDFEGGVGFAGVDSYPSFGAYAQGFYFEFDTSTLPAGSYAMKIVAECNGMVYEIGTRTSAEQAKQGGRCFVLNVTSTGAHYNAAPAAVAQASGRADVNGDGSVATDDAIYLLKNILNADGYPILSDNGNGNHSIIFEKGDVFFEDADGIFRKIAFEA